jgi:sulfatase maturation enzyme AslB (radical SAM superfamily)
VGTEVVDFETGTELRSPTPGKFIDPDWTATGEARASVALRDLETVWFNTGTLCNITCRNCYIESSPTNDRLVYLEAREVAGFLDEIARDRLGTQLIGFTGGEPFLNPQFLAMLKETLERGFEVLVLTNAMQPMQRPRLKQGLLELREAHGERLTLRVSLDHYTRELHEAERGPRSFAKTLAGLDWLSASGFQIAIAARTCWDEGEEATRAGFAALIGERGWCIDPRDQDQLFLLPEMDGSHEVPEITTRCWTILKKSPGDMMCASSRMIVKRKGAAAPTVLPCTLLPYDAAFEMGSTFQAAGSADGGMFAAGRVKLCHPHCAKFCVLGGGSCS